LRVVVLRAVDPLLLFARVAVPFAFVAVPFARVVALFARAAGFFAAAVSAPARVTADFVAFFTAVPAALAADPTPLAALFAVFFASLAAARASLACRVEAAFLPAAVDDVLCWFRLRVAAAFFAAAERSAFVCATGTPG
jgi:hypothetical protein